jgi:hypothetical protein
MDRWAAQADDPTSVDGRQVLGVAKPMGHLVTPKVGDIDL